MRAGKTARNIGSSLECSSLAKVLPQPLASEPVRRFGLGYATGAAGAAALLPGTGESRKL